MGSFDLMGAPRRKTRIVSNGTWCEANVYASDDLGCG